jgi:hypothetical protein
VIDDNLEHQGAKRLMRTIKAYWTAKHKRDDLVDVWLEDVVMGDSTICCVRSDLVNGLPKQLTGE